MTRWLVVIALLVVAARAQAQPVPLCLEVDAPPAQRDALRQLALAQLAHHSRTHRVATTGCPTTLSIRLLELDGVRYLTVRANQEIPVRHAFRDPAALDEKLSAALTLVLEHEPEHLKRDVSQLTGIQRALHSVLKRGHNRFRLELFQAVCSSGAGALSVPGGALTLQRGADHFQVFARLYFGGSPGDAGSDLQLEIFSGGDAGLTYELSQRASWSVYFSASMGVQLLSLEGRLRPDDPDSLESAIEVGATVGGRAGVRFFRLYNFDMDLFVMGYLPLFKTRDPDSALIDAYTPSMLVGIGIGF